MIYLASDHRGFRLKEVIKEYLKGLQFEVEDKGPVHHEQGDDYVDFAVTAATKIANDPTLHRGIFMCGSGHGVDIVANKFKGLYAVLCFNRDVAQQSREHEDANVLILPADWLDEEMAKDIVRIWLNTQFSGEERHMRRITKIREIEERHFKN